MITVSFIYYIYSKYIIIYNYIKFYYSKVITLKITCRNIYTTHNIYTTPKPNYNQTITKLKYIQTDQATDQQIKQ